MRHPIHPRVPLGCFTAFFGFDDTSATPGGGNRHGNARRSGSGEFVHPDLRATFSGAGVVVADRVSALAGQRVASGNEFRLLPTRGIPRVRRSGRSGPTWPWGRRSPSGCASRVSEAGARALHSVCTPLLDRGSCLLGMGTARRAASGRLLPSVVDASIPFA